MNKNTFYITTPIYYPNAKPHIGHIYTTLLADVLARYYRLVGKETYFLTGLDENAEKIGEAADKSGKKFGEFTDDIALVYKKIFSEMDFSYNQFIRTSDEKKHWPGAIEVWKRLVKSGDIYKGIYEGYYCVGCASFKTEKDLDDKGRCPDHETKPQKLKEDNYFFKLSKYTGKVQKAIESGEMAVSPESRRNEILSLLKEGLQDVSFSRPKDKIPWGIPVPGDSEHVMYVWGEALTNYISAMGFGGKDDSNFKKFWPADFHVMGKEISRFHVAIWPAMLMSAKLPLPLGIFIHGFILSGGRKMSKTIGNVLDPQEFIGEYGADALRYYLVREVSPIEDGDMTKEKFKEAYNANLANGIGNLASRILTMVENYDIDLGEMSLDSKSEVMSNDEIDEYHEALQKLQIDKAADFVWSLISFMDSYIQEEKPFKTIEDDEEKARRDIMFMVEKLWEVAVLLEPFLPETAEKIQSAIEHGKAPETLFPRKK